MSNTINYGEFKQAFVGAKMSEMEMKTLFNQLDINNDGEINYDEFLTGVRDKRLLNSKPGRLLQQDITRIQPKTRDDNIAIQILFRQLDTDMSNTINYNEFK